jgi:hypothetical protein
MAQLERGLREALLKDGCHILEALLNQPGALGACPPQGRLHEVRTRRVQSVLGCFELRRGYYQQGAQRSFPMDRVLGLSDSYTPGLLELMCEAAAVDGSYEEAEQTLRVFAGVHTPSAQIRKAVQQVAPALSAWGAERQTTSEQTEGRTLYISYDGTGVPMRKEETRGRKGKQSDGSAVTREVKLGCVFTSQGLDEQGHPLRDPQSTTYVAGFEPAEEFGARIRREALLRGAGRARRLAVIGDGAAWVWKLAEVNFPQATQILDFYHACEHLEVLAQALFPTKPEKVRERFRQWKRWMKTDRIEKVLAEAAQNLPHHGPRRDTAEREINYFNNNSSRIRYATFLAEGYFIGSGVVEAGCKSVVGKRTKQSGMFWRVPGAQRILDIRCAVLSGFYPDYWQYRREAQLDRLQTAA